MLKSQFKAQYSTYRKMNYDHDSSSSDRQSWSCGDQDAAFDRFDMRRTDFLEENAPVKAVVDMIDATDTLAEKAKDGWYLKHHYRMLKRSQRKSA
jgi:hypothetical protein